MYCSNCGNQVAENSNFCVNCGSNISGSPVVSGEVWSAARAEARRYYPLWRVGLLSLITFGAYFFYWFGVTWKQMGTQRTGRDHYPLLHALALFIPLFGFYVVHNHFDTIMGLQSREGIKSTLISPLPLIIFIVGVSVFPLIDEIAFGPNVTPLAFVFLPTVAALVVWGQANLNSYWRQVDGAQSSAAKFGPGEILLSVGGAIITTLALIGLFMSPSPSIYAISDAGDYGNLEIGEYSSQSISGIFEVDVFAFQPEIARTYFIETDPELYEANMDTLIAVWDQDGETVLKVADDNQGDAGESIEWVAPDNGTFYVSVEHASFGTGDYTIVVRHDR